MSFIIPSPKTTGMSTPTTSATIFTTPLSGAGDNKQTPKSTTLGLFGSTSTPTFSFGTPPTAKVATPTTTISKPTFGTLTTTSVATTTPQFNLGTSLATTAATTFTPISASGVSSATTTPQPALKFTITTTPTTTPAATAPATVIATAATAATTTAPTASTTNTTTPIGTTLTYSQLEDLINKWTIDLEEQNKFFINQAKQLNAWDNLLVSNSDKILRVNETIEKVKQEQKQLEQELDFVLAQQNELDDMSKSLEKELNQIQITDRNRFGVYELSEIVDTKMKQMSEDLKEIIEGLNEYNKNEDNTDPIKQISAILNAHMNSLQYIDKSSYEIKKHLEQVTKLREAYRKDHLNF